MEPVSRLSIDDFIPNSVNPKNALDAEQRPHINMIMRISVEITTI
jgi:hypothetical protein